MDPNLRGKENQMIKKLIGIGHRIQINWLFTILLMWIAVVTLSSVQQLYEESSLNVTHFFCLQPTSTDLLPPTF